MHFLSYQASSMIDCRAYNDAETCIKYGSDQVMFCFHLHLLLSNRPAKLATAKLKTAALVNLYMVPINLFDGLEFYGGALMET